MCEFWKDFLSSQLFGVILGSLLTAGFTCFLDWLKSKREEKIHLREKREETYLKVLDVLTRHEKCCREIYIREEEYEEYKKSYNDLLSYMMVYASPAVYREYYKLCNEISDAYSKVKKRKYMENTQNLNADKIEKFANKIRENLGIKEGISCQ